MSSLVGNRISAVFDAFVALKLDAGIFGPFGSIECSDHLISALIAQVMAEVKLLPPNALLQHDRVPWMKEAGDQTWRCFCKPPVYTHPLFALVLS